MGTPPSTQHAAGAPPHGDGREAWRAPARGQALAVVFLLVALSVSAAALLVFKAEQRAIVADEFATLDALADSKQREIAAWFRDRESEARALAGNPSYVLLISRMHADDAPPPQGWRFIEDDMSGLLASPRYRSVMLFDANGDLQVLRGSPPTQGANVAQAVSATVRTRQTLFTDVETQERGRRKVLIQMFTPVLESTRGDLPRVVGVFGFQIDPGHDIDTVLTTERARSSLEVLMLRPTRGELKYLSRPRHAQPEAGGAQNMYDLASAAPSSGLIDGVDYRGEPVIAVVERIPGTAWRLLVKVDQAEVLKPIRELAFWITGTTLLLLSLAAGFTFLWWRKERERYLAGQYRAELQRQLLTRHYDYLAKYANDAIILADADGNVLEVNDRAIELYGYSRKELLTMKVDALRAAHGEDDVWHRLKRESALVFETMHRARDGRAVPVEVSARVIEIGSRTYFQAIVRDITDRKHAEQRILRLTSLYAALSQTNEAIVRVDNADELLRVTCRIAVEHGQFVAAWVAWVSADRRRIEARAHYGERAAFFSKRVLPLDPAEPGGQGVTAQAVRTGEVVVSNNFDADPRSAHWLDTALGFGIHAASALPLRQGGAVVGVLAVYAREVNYFDAPMLNLLTEMSHNISFALDNFEREASRREAERATRESESRYRQLVDNMGSGMAVYDVRGDGEEFIFKEVNRALEHIENVRKENVIGKPLRDVFPGMERMGMYDVLRRVARTGQPEFVAARYYEDPERSGWRENYVYTLPTGEVVAVYEDVTDRKRFEQDLQQNQERLALVLEGVNDGYWDMNFENGEAYYSRRFGQMFGYTPEELGKTLDSWHALIYPDDRQKVVSDFEAHLEGRTARYQSEHRMITKSGEVLWVQARGSVVRRDANGKALRMAGMHQDISDKKRAEAQLRLWATVFEHSREAIFITDSERRIVSVNRAFIDMTGYSFSDVAGRDPHILSSGEHDRAFYQNMWAAISQSGHWQGEVRDRRKNGEIFPMFTAITSVVDNQGRLQNYIAICSDISERKAAEERIRYLAHHDVLTGLPNRALLDDRLAQAIAHAQRTSMRVAVLFVDLDRFKNINDSLGHHFGDELLKATGRRLRDCVRMDDTVCRQGGDEFVVVLTDVNDVADAAHVAQKIIESIAETFFIDGSEVHVTPSIGIAVYPEDGRDSQTLTRNADAAMYYAKESGRNNFQFFIADLNERALKRLSLESAMRRAIDHGDFVLHYQPQVNIWTGEVVGVEALVRWSREQGVLTMPAEFIPVAEETGLILPLGEWVLSEACRQQAAWVKAGLREFLVAVNISAAQFRRKDILPVFRRIVTSSCVSPRAIEMELTEGMIMRDAPASIAMLRALKDLGVTFAIDDFGTGYSSLSYLRRFPIDRLKVDQSFVHDLDKDAADRAITHAIIALAKSLGLKVIAEGVERHREIELLRESQCDELQGFYFAPPLAPDAFMQWWNTQAAVPFPLSAPGFPPEGGSNPNT